MTKMPLLRIATALILATLAVPASASSQTPPAANDSAPSSAPTPLPLTPSRTLRLTTDEGTWMSLDVSPDGRTIVFDLVGDLYTVPVAGGTAARISSGMGFDAAPRYSPDGKSIVFVTDRGGSDNLWVVNADGSNARALTKVEQRQFISPEWTPDGKYIVVSRNSALYSPQYDLFLYHREGGTGVKMSGTAPTPAGGGGGQQFGPPTPNNFVGAAFGNNSRYIYAATRQGAGGYNQTSLGWQISVYDRETGELSQRTNAIGSGMRPVLSPDGRQLVYASRVDTATKTSLRIRDLATGDERWLVHDVQRDDQESRFTRDLVPGMSFTPDGKSLIAGHHGKLWRIDVSTGRSTAIPFSADIDLQMGPLPKFEYQVNDSTLTVSQIRGGRPSPDGKRLAFTALDKLWVMDLPRGMPRRVTNVEGVTGEHSPVWSRDGRHIAYVTWTEGGGDIMRVRLDPRGRRVAPERLTRQRAYYTDINYTPDGARIVAYRGPRQPRIQEEFVYGRELIWLPAAGGATSTIAPVSSGGYPHFARESDRIYMYDQQDGLISMRFDGTDRKAVVKVTGYMDVRQTTPRATPADEILISPDGDRALVQADNHIYVVSVPAVGGQTPTISIANPANAAVPVKRLTRIGGDFAGWLGPQTVHYSIGHSYFTYDLARADSLVRDSSARADSARAARLARGGVARDSSADSARRARPDTAQPPDTARAGARPGEQVVLVTVDSSRVARSDTARKTQPAYEPERLDVLITVRRDKPEGSVLLRGARIITMKGEEVIENGDVLVTNNRIAAVGPAGSVSVPPGATTINVEGKTIIPGIVDVHAHLRPPFGIHKTQVWEYQANLAYGVTTTRDPQTGSTDVLSYGDLVETGDLLGPRIFSTGPGVFWSDDIKSLNDARDVLRRYTDYYNIHTIKQYMVGDRKVRQWVIMAAKELGLTPTLEGGLDAKKNLTEAIDGYAGIEHSIPIAPLYKDVIELLRESGTTYTPTLLVEYGGPWAENYWYQRHDVLADVKLARFTPRSELLARGLRRPGWWHASQYSFELLAQQVAKLVEAGGKVGVGGHGQLQGLGVHWELWTIASGGLKPHDALKVATIYGAQALGLHGALGSIETGKLADMVVLDANPLQNIQNTNTVRFVMKNGRLHDGNTLAEIWPRRRDVPTPWWLIKDDIAAAAGGDEH